MDDHSARACARNRGVEGARAGRVPSTHALDRVGDHPGGGTLLPRVLHLPFRILPLHPLPHTDLVLSDRYWSRITDPRRFRHVRRDLSPLLAIPPFSVPGASI